jgi:hypothetical protein
MRPVLPPAPAAHDTGMRLRLGLFFLLGLRLLLLRRGLILRVRGAGGDERVPPGDCNGQGERAKEEARFDVALKGVHAGKNLQMDSVNRQCNRP